MKESAGGRAVELDWHWRLFGVGCDAEESERWFEAFCIFEHLLSIGPADVEIRLRLGRAAFQVGRVEVAREQSLEVDHLLHLCKELRQTFGGEAVALRNSLQRYDFEQYEDECRDFSNH